MLFCNSFSICKDKFGSEISLVDSQDRVEAATTFFRIARNNSGT